MMSTETTFRPRPTDSAKSVLLTVLGEFVLPNGGEVWTGALVDALATHDYGGQNSRQAIARLKDDGIITSQRLGRKTRWCLTTDGDRLLRAGAERIYQFGQRTDKWDGWWLVILCSVPEVQREKRRRFRARLSFAGFGFISPTVAISPHLDAEPAANQVLAELEITDTAIVLRAQTGTLSPDRDMLERAWDLKGLSDTYARFLARFTDIEPISPDDHFRELVRLVHAWRHFPFSDPEIPLQLLPPDWIGEQGRKLFEAKRRAWSSEASAFYNALEAGHD